MLLPLVVCAAALQEQHDLIATTYLRDARTKVQTSLLEQMVEPSRKPKVSPKSFGDPPEHWSFPWVTAGYGSINDHLSPLRMLVYSQEREPNNDRALGVARMLMRLWEYDFNTLKLDHSIALGNGVVQVYLCDKGRPGGEQLYDVDPQDAKGEAPKVNTIYFYDLATFTDPVEMAREVAHEYGHATLPGIGGYTEPEYWANGYLGERLFLRHMLRSMKEGRLGPEDTMGATMPQLSDWVVKNVDPLVQNGATVFPGEDALGNKSSAGMNAYMGLALYMDTILPESAFSRSMQMVGSSNAVDYPDSIVLAAEEPSKYTLDIPPYLIGKTIWVPLGTNRLSGAPILKRRNGWVQIKPEGTPVVETSTLAG